MTSWPILSLVTFLPLVGAFFCLIVNGPKEAVERNCRSIAIVTSGVTFLISLIPVSYTHLTLPTIYSV